jgi:hypothetical protein
MVTIILIIARLAVYRVLLAQNLHSGPSYRYSSLNLVCKYTFLSVFTAIMNTL